MNFRSHQMLYHSFPDLQWLKRQAESRFANGRAWNGYVVPSTGWPNVILNVKTLTTVRDNIPGPLSLFSNITGQSLLLVDNRTTVVKEDHFFISNNSQRYTLEIEKKKSAETFNIHFGQHWMNNIVENESIEFYNKLYPKDDVVRYLQSQLKVADKTLLEREELLTKLIVHLLLVNRQEKIRVDNLDAKKVSTREDIIRRLHLSTDHIYACYDTDVSLDDLARISMLSKFHFLRGFRQAFGMAPHQFLNKVRIEKAKELLRLGFTVTETGRMVGITDSSSFSRLFKKLTTLNPTAFRN